MDVGVVVFGWAWCFGVDLREVDVFPGLWVVWLWMEVAFEFVAGAAEGGLSVEALFEEGLDECAEAAAFSGHLGQFPKDNRQRVRRPAAGGCVLDAGFADLLW